MTLPTSSILLAMAAAPSFLLLAVAMGIFQWRRSIGAITAMMFSLGGALVVQLLLAVAAYGSDALYGLQESLVALVGVPLLVYAMTMAGLTKRATIPVLRAIACAAVGLVGLYYVGGFVLLTSACSFNSGGC